MRVTMEISEHKIFLIFIFTWKTFYILKIVAENTEQKFYHLNCFEVYSTVVLLHVRPQGVWGPSGGPMGEDSETCQSPAQKHGQKTPLTLQHWAAQLHFWVKVAEWARKHTHLEIKRKELAKTTAEIHWMGSRGGLFGCDPKVEWMLRAAEAGVTGFLAPENFPPWIGAFPYPEDMWCATKEDKGLPWWLRW